MEIIVNATGSDYINLWYLSGNKITKRQIKNHSWIFVSGNYYDMSMLERSLDFSNLVYEHTKMRDIYGYLDGIKIFMRPSQINYIAKKIENSFGYKIKIYNADINPVLRFMALNRLSFFKIRSLYDYDPDIKTAEIYAFIKNNDVSYITINGKKYEKNIYEELYNAIDDGLIIIYNNYYGEFSILLNNMFKHGYAIEYKTHRARSFESYGRHSYMPKTISINNKICIDSNSFIFQESGITGIVELSRLSLLPPETVSVVTPGTVVSSIEEKEALQRKILIPFRKTDYEKPKTPGEFFEADSGGIVFTPDPGIYKNVYEIDFSSMYPSIMVNYNLSPENLSSAGMGHLAMFLRGLLETRLFYKGIRERSDIYMKRDMALKSLLLNSFGYTGYKNAKFGRIDVHEKITSIGRSIIMNSIRIAEKNGFNFIHGVVDSMWIYGDGDIQKTINEIYERTRIPIVIDSHYKWIAFLPKNNGIGSANSYIGYKYDGTFKVRGIEMRRKNIPEFIKKFQENALNEIKCDFEQISFRREKIDKIKRYYLNKISSFKVDDFKIKFTISRHINEYKVRNGTYYLMKYLDGRINIYPGMSVDGIIIDKRHGIIRPDAENIDRDYYKRMLIRSFKPIDFILLNSGK